jgi:hypothetical protein
MASEETLKFIPQVHISMTWLPAEFRNLLDDMWHAATRMVEVLRYEPEYCGFESRGCQWNFSLT